MVIVPLFRGEPIAYTDGAVPGTKVWSVGLYRFVWTGKHLMWFSPWGIETLAEIHRLEEAVQFAIGFHVGKEIKEYLSNRG